MPSTYITGQSYVVPISAIETMPVSYTYTVPVVAPASPTINQLVQTEVSQVYPNKITSNPYIAMQLYRISQDRLTNIANILNSIPNMINTVNTTQKIVNTLAPIVSKYNNTNLNAGAWHNIQLYNQALATLNTVKPRLQSALSLLNTLETKALGIDPALAASIANGISIFGNALKEIIAPLPQAKALNIGILNRYKTNIDLNKIANELVNLSQQLESSILLGKNLNSIIGNLKNYTNVISQYLPILVGMNKIALPDAFVIAGLLNKAGLSINMDPLVAQATQIISNIKNVANEIINTLPNTNQLITLPDNLANQIQSYFLNSILANPVMLNNYRQALNDLKNILSMNINFSKNPASALYNLFTNYNNALSSLNSVFSAFANSLSLPPSVLDISPLQDKAQSLKNILSNIETSALQNNQIIYFNNQQYTPQQFINLINNYMAQLNSLDNVLHAINTLNTNFYNAFNAFKKDPTIQNYLNLINYAKTLQNTIKLTNDLSTFLNGIDSATKNLASSLGYSIQANAFVSNPVRYSIKPLDLSALATQIDNLFTSFSKFLLNTGEKVVSLSYLPLSLADPSLAYMLKAKTDNLINQLADIAHNITQNSINTILEANGITLGTIYNMLKGFGYVESQGLANIYTDINNYIKNNWPSFANDLLSMINSSSYILTGKNIPEPILNQIRNGLDKQAVNIANIVSYAVPGIGPLGHLFANPNEPTEMKIFDLVMTGLSIFAVSDFVANAGSGIDTALQAVYKDLLSPLGKNVIFSVGMNEAIDQIANLISGKGLLSLQQAKDALISGVIFGVLSYPIAEGLSFLTRATLANILPSVLEKAGVSQDTIDQITKIISTDPNIAKITNAVLGGAVNTLVTATYTRNPKALENTFIDGTLMGLAIGYIAPLVKAGIYSLGNKAMLTTVDFSSDSWQSEPSKGISFEDYLKDVIAFRAQDLGLDVDPSQIEFIRDRSEITDPNKFYVILSNDDYDRIGAFYSLIKDSLARFNYDSALLIDDKNLGPILGLGTDTAGWVSSQKEMLNLLLGSDYADEIQNSLMGIHTTNTQLPKDFLSIKMGDRAFDITNMYFAPGFLLNYELITPDGKVYDMNSVAPISYYFYSGLGRQGMYGSNINRGFLYGTELPIWVNPNEDAPPSEIMSDFIKGVYARQFTPSFFVSIENTETFAKLREQFPSSIWNEIQLVLPAQGESGYFVLTNDPDTAFRVYLRDYLYSIYKINGDGYELLNEMNVMPAKTAYIYDSDGNLITTINGDNAVDLLKQIPDVDKSLIIEFKGNDNSYIGSLTLTKEDIDYISDIRNGISSLLSQGKDIIIPLFDKLGYSDLDFVAYHTTNGKIDSIFIPSEGGFKLDDPADNIQDAIDMVRQGRATAVVLTDESNPDFLTYSKWLLLNGINYTDVNGIRQLADYHIYNLDNNIEMNKFVQPGAYGNIEKSGSYYTKLPLPDYYDNIINRLGPLGRVLDYLMSSYANITTAELNIEGFKGGSNAGFVNTGQESMENLPLQGGGAENEIMQLGQQGIESYAGLMSVFQRQGNQQGSQNIPPTPSTPPVSSIPQNQENIAQQNSQSANIQQNTVMQNNILRSQQQIQQANNFQQTNNNIQQTFGIQQNNKGAAFQTINSQNLIQNREISPKRQNIALGQNINTQSPAISVQTLQTNNPQNNNSQTFAFQSPPSQTLQQESTRQGIQFATISQNQNQLQNQAQNQANLQNLNQQQQNIIDAIQTPQQNILSQLRENINKITQEQQQMQQAAAQSQQKASISQMQASSTQSVAQTTQAQQASRQQAVIMQTAQNQQQKVLPAQQKIIQTIQPNQPWFLQYLPEKSTEKTLKEVLVLPA